MEPKINNPFLTPSALDGVRLREMCELASKTYARGWNAGTAGNFSIRSTMAEIMWVSPSGYCKGELQPSRFIPIQLKNGLPQGVSLSKPSDETALHAGILRAAKGAVCVAHAHPPHLVKASMQSARVSFSGYEMQKAFGVQTHEGTIALPTIDNTQDMTTLGANVARYLDPSCPVLILRGHGVYVWADDVQKALNLIEALEFLCSC